MYVMFQIKGTMVHPALMGQRLILVSRMILHVPPQPPTNYRYIIQC